MRKVIISIVMAAAILMIVMALTKPDDDAHYALVKAIVRSEVSNQLGNNKLVEEYGNVVLYEALGKANDYVDHRLRIRNFICFTLGTVRHQDMTVPITLGIFNHVILIGDEDEIKKAIVKKMSIQSKPS